MDGLGKLGIGVASLAIILVVTFLIMAQANTNMRSDSTACDTGSWNGSGCCTNNCVGGNFTLGGTSLAYNATGTLTEATATIPGWVSIIIITVIGALLIGMVKMFKR